MKDTVKIGICGRSGSGKGYVCKLFASYGGIHIDTDAVYHSLLEPKDGEASECAKAIADAFGKRMIKKDKTVDRRRLGKAVFSDRAKLDALNALVHPYIIRKTLDIVKESGAPFALIDAPLLFESGVDAECDFTVLVRADDESCVRRIVKRDGIGEEDAAFRLASQTDTEVLAEKCDFVIDNSIGDDPAEDVKRILKKKGLISDEA